MQMRSGYRLLTSTPYADKLIGNRRGQQQKNDKINIQHPDNAIGAITEWRTFIHGSISSNPAYNSGDDQDKDKNILPFTDNTRTSTHSGAAHIALTEQYRCVINQGIHEFISEGAEI